MKKVLSILLMLMVLFMASCSDDENTPNSNGKDDDKEQIDERLIGKWKVEYSKTITPAIYIENEEDLNKRPNNQDLVIGLNHPDDATVLEYFGEKHTEIDSYMFNKSEEVIEVTQDGRIKIYWFSLNGGLIDAKADRNYYIDNNYFILGNKDSAKLIHKYSIEKDFLKIELIRAEEVNGDLNNNLTEYRISKYSKITE